MLLAMLQVFALVFAAAALVPAAAHALELPGKMKLPRGEYVAVQSIYYPGFTLAGIAEALSIPATFVLLLATPRHSASFWLTLGALIGLTAVHAVFWLITQPVNRVWMEEQSVGKAGARFFAAGPREAPHGADWTALRDRWERSHVARAALAGASFVALVIAVVMRR